jgi:uncharacterized surface protein with fasciclin (FAS1) repeats
MKKQITTAALFGLMGSMVLTSPASANNTGVESALRNYSDLSVFYSALVNTGVAAELNENTNYTIFAPTNEAFADISPDQYPCFYAVQCRAQVADVVRNHIVVGQKTLKELTSYPDVPTLGRYEVFAQTPYTGQYEIGDHRVLSAAEIHGNEIIRLDGVVVHRDQMAQFRNYPSASGATIVEQKTVTTTYSSPASYPIPGGGTAGYVAERTYVAPATTAVIYSDGHRRVVTSPVLSTEHTYVAPATTPGGAPPDAEMSTITRTITTEP